MTDDELNRRVAEIEGESDRYEVYSSRPPHDYVGCWFSCGPLIEKYKLDIYYDNHPGDSEWTASYGIKVDEYDDKTVVDKDLKRAICLAVLETHSDQ